MVFSSIVFLFLFFPVVLSGYYLILLLTGIRKNRSASFLRLANGFLLVVSLLFYFWGENWLVWIIITSTLIDYVCGLLISNAFSRNDIKRLPEGGKRTSLQKAGLIFSICSNLFFLGVFKYFNFGVDSVNALLPESWKFHDVIRISLPLGISFYTFQSMSYTIDVYRGRVKATRNLIDFACYVTLFPQLVAGPIVRYADLAHQLLYRRISSRLFVTGINRFIIGLGKKVLIANTVAQAADAVFSLPGAEVTPLQAWVAAVCYTLQIYYDFSGYSDMAIGIGRMLGFEIPENFNYPYISRSIREFWRRWHISLSTWFRDYLYIPLGGNQKGALRTYFNLVLVFSLCGLWHGAAWSFVAWGLYHGFFLILEHLGWEQRLKRLPGFIGHGYVLMVVMAGWILFATESLGQAIMILKAMLGFTPVHQNSLLLRTYLSNDIISAMFVGIIFSTPLLHRKRKLLMKKLSHTSVLYHSINTTAAAGLVIIFLLSAMSLAAGTYNPFIYFRF